MNYVILCLVYGQLVVTNSGCPIRNGVRCWEVGQYPITGVNAVACMDITQAGVVVPRPCPPEPPSYYVKELKCDKETP